MVGSYPHVKSSLRDVSNDETRIIIFDTHIFQRKGGAGKILSKGGSYVSGLL